MTHVHHSVGFGECADCVERESKIEKLLADVERLRAILADIAYDKTEIAKKQREACAVVVEKFALLNRNTRASDVRDTPLVTED